MTIIESIQQHTTEFSKSELKVSQYILKYPEHVETFTITKLADRAGTSTSAVLRFCQSLGFQGYKDFRFEMINYLRGARHHTSTSDLSDGFLNDYAQLITQLHQLDAKLLKKLATALMTPTMNYLLGVHFSALPAKELFLGLEDLGILSLHADDYINAAHLTNTMAPDSTLVLFSISGSKNNFNHFLASVANNMPKNSFLITMNPKAELAAAFEQTLVLPGSAFSNRSVVDAQAVPMLFVELLLNIIHEKQ
ncbi:MurR/RpiR family transcriptional regulator [Lactiplantibacillus fabifermentans]|uniref:HTH rpiR-type domain-containing protein n=2 Tax=Lactiplantibacillus fabifermentans TaxID=483011 RepID=A0A0R2NCW5_9LACO|nr:MurR/RpiR family transcriptional regulator [Lactiplantibacillus fabifermentans]ETY74229.1 RpiR family transcriptional regulator [Lactiplantibacillus fabifermentans T30PCM01]KRO23705.1 hypothetical protein DY78_GL001742 [Lactiplantibacillus fabifermentans DSM 21115]